MWHPHSLNDLKKAEAAQTRQSGFFHPELLGRTEINNGRKTVSEGGHHPITTSALREHLGNGSFTIMTAQNPNAKKLLPHQNQLRNLELENDLKRTGAVYHRVKGKYGNEEDSYMIHHTSKVTPEHLERLARDYGQESVLHSSKGKHQLKYVTGENAGKHHPGEGYTFDENSKDFHTQLPNRPESKFTANVNFGEMSKSEKPSGTFPFEVPTHDGKKHIVHFHVDRSKLH